jgi:hypothetical protein
MIFLSLLLKFIFVYLETRLATNWVSVQCCILGLQEEVRVLQQPCLLSAIKFSNVHLVKVHKKDKLFEIKNWDNTATKV